MTAYVLKSAFALAMLYTCFALLLSRETLHKFNRVMLLGIVVASMVLPTVCLRTSQSTTIGKVVQTMDNYRKGIIPVETSDIMSNGIVADNSVQQETDVSEEQSASLRVMDAAELLYLLGLCIVLSALAYRAIGLLRLLRGGLRTKDAHGNTIIIKGGDCPPFSFWHYIVISAKDYEQHRRSILTHEQEHARLGHSYDLLMMEVLKVVQWFNPFVYLLERDLRAVHEYQADEAVIRQGIDATQYQILLVTKAVGMRLQPLANSLSRSKLKNRILMMKRKQSSHLACLKAACLLPVVAVSLMASATVVNENGQNNVAADDNSYVYTFERNEELEYDPQKPLPQSANRRYDMIQYWLEQHMQYTDEMRRRGIGGDFTVQPYVKADGSFTDVKMDDNIDPVLKAEVMRLLNGIPKPLLKGALPLTTREGYTYITVSIFDPTLARQPFNKPEKLISYHESFKKGQKVPRSLRAGYTVCVPLGATYTDADGSSRIIKRRDLIYLNGMASDYFRVGVTADALLLLDGVPFDKNSLPELSADNLKEIIFKKDFPTSDLHYEGTARGTDITATGERFTVELKTK